jgi:predicted ATPase/DNA-binding SARP family transcriptional activator
MRVHIRLLGGFDVTVDGHPVQAQAWRRRAATDLVKLLALQPDRRLLRDRVVDALWPELLVDDAAPRLHVAAHYARTALRSRDAVVLGRGAVTLLPEADVSVDVVEFERAADLTGHGSDPEAAEWALAAYGGELLPDDVYQPWTEAPRERLRLRRRELLMASGRYADAVDADPLDEEAQLALVGEHVRQGRRQPALRALDRMAEVFRAELGVEPGPGALAIRRRAEALPADPVVPEQRSAPARGRAPLPASRTRLVGRGADLDALAELLERHRVVTVVGPGGVGKSTLALEVARRAQTDGTDEGRDVVLAELAPAREQAAVVRTVADAAGVQGEGAVRLAELARTLGARPLLLVLDNCEHLLDDAAALVDAVLDAGPRVRVLATSREPLRVDGEVVHRLGSLGAQSVELFVERAVAAAGPAAVDADDPRGGELCDRLDGLPLAIELAAAQLGHLSMQDLVDRLDDRLTLLVGGRPRAGARHSALAATIEWSHRLLSEQARGVFDRLGVFPAGFDLGAVVAVCPPHDERTVTNLLGDLVAKSLVVHDPERRRYHLLETIRLFAAARLEESGQLPEARELLRRHVVARSTSVPRVRAWLSADLAARSRDDIDNVRLAFEASLDRGDLSAAVDVALGLGTLWRNAVSYAEGRRWVAALRSRPLTAGDLLWTSILEADVGLGSGDPQTMRGAAAEALTLGREVEEPGAVVIATIYDAMTRLSPGQAADLLAEATATARRLEEPGLERLARAFRVVALAILGRKPEPAEDLGDPVEAAGHDYDRYIAIWTASLLAMVARDAAELRRLLRAQLGNLAASGLNQNWLTMYWAALSLVASGQDYLPQLRRARRRAVAEGRGAEADCVLALAYAAACRDDWVAAAELVGAAAAELQRDTAGFIHFALVQERLVRPHLDATTFAAAVERGRGTSLEVILQTHGL